MRTQTSIVLASLILLPLVLQSQGMGRSAFQSNNLAENQALLASTQPRQEKDESRHRGSGRRDFVQYVDVLTPQG